MELSGGQFQPPVQTLVAISIFAKGENANTVKTIWEKTEEHLQGIVRRKKD